MTIQQLTTAMEQNISRVIYGKKEKIDIYRGDMLVACGRNSYCVA